ncbi:MAG: hypothetical protein U0074_05520 [Kouleothrix sp.]
MSRAETPAGTGRFADAQTELQTALEWLRTAEQRDTQRAAEALLVRSEQGLPSRGTGTRRTHGPRRC